MEPDGAEIGRAAIEGLRGVLCASAASITAAGKPSFATQSVNAERKPWTWSAHVAQHFQQLHVRYQSTAHTEETTSLFASLSAAAFANTTRAASESGTMRALLRFMLRRACPPLVTALPAPNDCRDSPELP